MCAIFGFLNYGKKIKFRTLKRLVKELSIACEVRGTDATRINVTANGIPMNDAESHGLFWVNMPDFASSLKDIQIQRGAGTSTNGAGAFGASINMLTQSAGFSPSAEFNASYGSFNTHKETVKVSSGLLNNHWTVDARISNIGTDGLQLLS